MSTSEQSLLLLHGKVKSSLYSVSLLISLFSPLEDICQVLEARDLEASDLACPSSSGGHWPQVSGHWVVPCILPQGQHRGHWGWKSSYLLCELYETYYTIMRVISILPCWGYRGLFIFRFNLSSFQIKIGELPMGCSSSDIRVVVVSILDTIQWLQEIYKKCATTIRVAIPC